MIDRSGRFSLKGKMAYVAGGAGLIGAAVSRACAGAGARVVVLDTDTRKARALVKRIGGRACLLSPRDRQGSDKDEETDEWCSFHVGDGIAFA